MDHFEPPSIAAAAGVGFQVWLAASASGEPANRMAATPSIVRAVAHTQDVRFTTAIHLSFLCMKMGDKLRKRHCDLSWYWFLC